MKTLIVGASGATGKLLVEQLLAAGKAVKIIVRVTAQIPAAWLQHQQLQIIQGNVAEMTVDELADLVVDCDAVASCLGHNLNFKGLFGRPRNLVTNSVKLICTAIPKNNPTQAVKFVLMNTAGNRNRNLNEPISIAERMVISLLRLLLPPHPDNEKAADYLRLKVGEENSRIEWAVVRPDTLLDEAAVTDYSLHASPTSSAIFNPGQSSRINTAHFMAQLIINKQLWHEWKGQMPVIYNKR